MQRRICGVIPSCARSSSATPVTVGLRARARVRYPHLEPAAEDRKQSAQSRAARDRARRGLHARLDRERSHTRLGPYPVTTPQGERYSGRRRAENAVADDRGAEGGAVTVLSVAGDVDESAAG